MREMGSYTWGLAGRVRKGEKGRREGGRDGEVDNASDIPRFISVERHLSRVYFPLGLISDAAAKWHGHTRVHTPSTSAVT